jgi:hypothetical protein
VVPQPRAAESKGRQNGRERNLNEKKLISRANKFYITESNSLQGNAINNCEFF